MELRVSGLEEQFGRIESLLRGIDERVRGVEVDLAELKGRVATLPTAWVMMTTMIGGQLTLGALVFAILKAFGPK